jgi:dTMP kinase
MFATFEGLDYAGKSTCMKRAESWLIDQGCDVCCVRDPGGTNFGEAVRKILLDRSTAPSDSLAESLAFFAARQQLLVEKIRPALNCGKWVLCDRFFDSTLAYQGGGKEVDLGWLHEVDRLVTRGFRPALTLWFEIDPSLALARRVEPGQEPDVYEMESLAFFARVHDVFSQQAQDDRLRIQVIDGSSSAEEAWLQCRRCLERYLETEQG